MRSARYDASVSKSAALRPERHPMRLWRRNVAHATQTTTASAASSPASTRKVSRFDRNIARTIVSPTPKTPTVMSVAPIRNVSSNGLSDNQNRKPPRTGTAVRIHTHANRDEISRRDIALFYGGDVLQRVFVWLRIADSSFEYFARNIRSAHHQRHVIAAAGATLQQRCRARGPRRLRQHVFFQQ